MSYGVVIPAYYGRPYIHRALASVFSQEGIANLKVVVVEDGTPDPHRVQDLVSEFPAEYLRLNKNGGVFLARWSGWQYLQGTVDYLAFLDQDDAWHPTFLQKMTRELQSVAHCGFAACNAQIISEHASRPLYQERQPNLLLADLKVANQLISPSQVLIQASSLETLALVPDLPYPGSDDWLLWLAILAQGYHASYRHVVLVDYYDHQNGAHQDSGAIKASAAYIADHWFSRLNFSPWDQRLYHGRVHWDNIAVGIRNRQPLTFLEGARGFFSDPAAVWAARAFRRRHKAQGIV